ncbi:MAG: endo alpha-1,4 polygalactosaminidase [Eubacterium sp.]|nr:endo alpha-1,4 polygalactosaminidase [Eubacterium sp.]
MAGNAERRIPVIPLLVIFLAAAIALILLYILPGRYRLYQTTLYDPLEEAPANPLMGFAPDARKEKDCENAKLVLIDLSWENWEPAAGNYDTDYLKEEFHLEEYKEKNLHGVLRFDCTKPDDGHKRDIKKAIGELGKYFSKDSFISFVEISEQGAGCLHEFEQAFPDAHLILPAGYKKLEETGCGVYFAGLGESEKQKKALEEIAYPDYWKNAVSGGAFSGEKDIKDLLNKDLAEILQEIRDGHLTYISGTCPGEEDQKGNGYRMISQTLGYCIYIKSMQTTVNFRKDTVTQRFTFTNTGVAPCYADWPVVMTIHNRDGKKIHEVELPMTLKKLLPGRDMEVTGEFPYDKRLKKGYSLGIRICNPKDKNDFIILSQKETRPDKNGEHIIYRFEPENRREKVSIAQPDSYQNAMINLLADLSDYAKSKNPDFAMITNGGYKLYMPKYNTSEENLLRLTSTMDGMLVESLFYGWGSKDNRKTPDKVSAEMQEAVKDAQEADLPAFNIEYCSNKQTRKTAAQKSKKLDTVWFCAKDMELTQIPELPYARVHDEDCREPADAENFLALLNPDYYKTKSAYLKALRNTNYDIIFIDLEFGGKNLTKKDIDSLRNKKEGGKRMVCAYMSIGEAENYRDYWQESWNKNPPPWICEVNDEWAGNYKVMYWTKAWRDILFGKEDSYLDQIMAAGFDGVYLDVVDAYEYFEEQQ